MKTVRIAIAIASVAATVLVVTADVGTASTRSCPSAGKTTGDTVAAARPVTKDYATIQAAAAAAGVTMASDRQVVAVMAYPTFIDTRVAAAHNGCRIIGATANTTGAKSTATGRAPLVWTPKLPVTFSGERFVTSSAGSITIEIRVTPLSQWHRYVATSRSMRWTSGG